MKEVIRESNADGERIESEKIRPSSDEASSPGKRQLFLTFFLTIRLIN